MIRKLENHKYTNSLFKSVCALYVFYIKKFTLKLENNLEKVLQSYLYYEISKLSNHVCVIYSRNHFKIM